MAATPQTGASALVQMDQYAKQVGATLVRDQQARVTILQWKQEAWIVYPVSFATFPGETSHTAAIVGGRLELPAAVLSATLGPAGKITPTATNTAGNSPQPAGATSGASMADRLIGIIKSVLGTPYLWGGESLQGFDCSGLVQWALGRMGIWVPRTSRAQWYYTAPVKTLAPGDLVFFSTDGPGPTHVGVYVGLGQFASADNRGVSFSSLWVPYWHTHYVGARDPLTHTAG